MIISFETTFAKASEALAHVTNVIEIGTIEGRKFWIVTEADPEQETWLRNNTTVNHTEE